MPTRSREVYGAALTELLVRMIEQQSYGIQHLSGRLGMADTEPTDEQKLTEAITAEASMYRAVVRNVLHQVAVLVGRAVDDLGPELRGAIDALFHSRRVMLHEWLSLARGIIVRQQLQVGRLEDRADTTDAQIVALDAQLAAAQEEIAHLRTTIQDLRAAAGLNSIGETE
jgi:hypothetical protein